MILLLLAGLLLSACTLTPQPAAPPLDLYMAEAAPLISEQRYSAAIEILEQAAETHPAEVTPLLTIGRIYLAQQRWLLGEDAFNRAMARDPANGAAMAGLAEIKLAQGDWPGALALWQRAAALDPGLPGVLTGLGRTHLLRLAFDEARTAFTRQQAIRPDPAAQWYLAALAAPLDVAAANEQLLAIPPDAPAELLARRDYLLAALAPFTTDSPPAVAAQAAGIALVQAGQWPLAVHALSVASDRDANQPAQTRARTRAFLGHALAQAGQPALELFEQARRLDPESALPLYFYGIYLRRQQALAAAAQAFEQALRLDPGNAAIHVELAQTRAEQGQLSAAEEYLAQAVAQAPDDLEIQLARVRFYAGRGYRVSEAGLPIAQALVEDYPASAEAHDWLGWLSYLAGQPAQAETAYRRAIELDPELVSARYHLGRLLAQTGQTAAAKSEYQWVIDRDREGIYRAQALEQLTRLEKQK